MRAYTDIKAIERDLVADLATLAKHLPATPETEDALCAVETFCAVSLRVMTKTNPSKIKDAARAEEIKARMDGRPVVGRSEA